MPPLPPSMFVHLSSQRTLEPVRQDGCFAEKQGPGPCAPPHRPERSRGRNGWERPHPERAGDGVPQGDP